MKTEAIIPAGGAGRRLGSKLPKQYLDLYGRPILSRTLGVFQAHEAVGRIVVVAPVEDIDTVWKDVVKPYGLTKVQAVVAGGAERQDSVRNGLAALAGNCDYVLVHDGVRPLLTADMITRCLAAAGETGAASVGVRVKDTVKQTSDGDWVLATLPREQLWLVQTPQAFAVDIIRKAHQMALNEGYTATDDASLVERIGVRVRMIEGSGRNIKITTREDLTIAEAFMKDTTGSPGFSKTGFGYDSHRFAPGRKLILGGVEIPSECGLQGHSDADALSHALCDALLGAAGCGDIGRHFPDSDLAFKNISSLILLARVRQIIDEAGFSIHNVDASVLMEKPKLAPHAEAIATRIAEALDIPASAVNIKAKTNEGMGFVGRGEGVAVFATALVSERTDRER